MRRHDEYEECLAHALRVRVLASPLLVGEGAEHHGDAQQLEQLDEAKMVHDGGAAVVEEVPGHGAEKVDRRPRVQVVPRDRRLARDELVGLRNAVCPPKVQQKVGHEEEICSPVDDVERGLEFEAVVEEDVDGQDAKID